MEAEIYNRQAKISIGPRIDLKDKVTGAAIYVEDLPDLPGTAYGAALLSPYSHARIRSIDSSAALKLPGVLAVVDREHLEGANPRLKLAPHEHLKAVDDQDFVAIEVYQGMSDVASENRFLGRFMLGDLPRGRAGKVRVEVLFTLDADGILEVSATEMSEGRAAAITIEAASGLSANELERLGVYR